MQAIGQHLRRVRIARRRDLLRSGYTDRHIGNALRRGEIHRIRQGWYAARDIGRMVAEVVRVGGRLTGMAALSQYGLFLPRQARLDIAVPRHANGLRSLRDYRKRLTASDPVRLHWTEAPRRDRPPSDWLASEREALAIVLRTEPMELAVAACDGLVRYRNWSAADVDSAFAAAPHRVQGWRARVDGRADAWGETLARLRLLTAGFRFEPQAFVPGAGHYDGRLSANVYLEVDGEQHGEHWMGDAPSSFESDHTRDAVLAALGGKSIRVTYRQLLEEWDLVLAAVERAVRDDEA